MTKILAWHFLKDDGSYCWGRGTPPPGGIETINVALRPLKLCCWGLHASRNILDALEYAGGALLRRVELSGEIREDGDKICASTRRELWRMDIADVLHEFGYWCAERVVKHLHKPCPQFVNTLFENALKAKWAWLRGECNDETLDKIRVSMQDVQANVFVKTTFLLDAVRAVEFAMWPRSVTVGRSASFFGRIAMAAQTRDYFATIDSEKEAQCRKLLRMIRKARKEKGEILSPQGEISR